MKADTKIEAAETVKRPRGRGRPKGSKNKPRAIAEASGKDPVAKAPTKKTGKPGPTPALKKARERADILSAEVSRLTAVLDATEAQAAHAVNKAQAWQGSYDEAVTKLIKAEQAHDELERENVGLKERVARISNDRSVISVDRERSKARGDAAMEALTSLARGFAEGKS